MLDRQLIKRIEDFVRTRPRTVDEIAKLLGKNWRTAASYVDRIAQEQGTIATHTFRGGTRGAADREREPRGLVERTVQGAADGRPASTVAAS
jgi:hypothetical protein